MTIPREVAEKAAPEEPKSHARNLNRKTDCRGFHLPSLLGEFHCQPFRILGFVICHGNSRLR